MCPSLVADEIHVWQIDLRDHDCVSSGLVDVLSAEEKARAERFFFPRDREAYSICRGGLRHILGSYCGVKPQAVKFSRGPHGKPQLDEPFSKTALQFNVSHSQGIGLIAVARGMAVGVDVECVRPIPDAESIAQAHYSSKEREHLSRLPASKSNQGFLSCWTRKEAFVKAKGGGLSIPLNSFSVSETPGGEVEILISGDTVGKGPPWRVVDLQFEEVGSGKIYVGALVGAGLRWNTTVSKWQPPGRLLVASKG